MDWGIAIIVVVVILLIVFLLFFFFRRASSSSAPVRDQKITRSETPIDLSAFDKICLKEGDDGKIDFQPISEDDKIMMSALFSRERPLTRDLIRRNPSFKIAYTDNKGEKTARDVIPHRIVGYVIENKDGTKEYDFYIEAFCLLRNQERSVHTNGISAARYRGGEINLGDYLATLYRKNKKKK
jgi:hypothetical protein